MSVSLYGSGNTVIQVVNATYSTATVTTSTSFIPTTLTATITPQSTTSKILVVGQTFVYVNGSTIQASITIARNGTNLVANTGLGGLYNTSGGYSETILPFSWLDSPSTTSATTYTIYGGITSGSGTISIGSPTRTASITLIEISGS